MKKLTITIVCILLVSTSIAAAKMYKYQQANGTWAYSNTPRTDDSAEVKLAPISTLPSPSNSARTDPQRRHGQQKQMLMYVVRGKGWASLTYKNESSGTEQRKVKLPWSKRFSVRNGFHAYISAQNMSYGNIKVKIVRNGEVIKYSNSVGRYSIASASTSM